MLRKMVKVVPGAATAVDSRAIRSLRAAWRRHGAVEGSLKFTTLELLGPRGRLGTYTLTGSAVSVVLRHRTRDVEIFEEIFVGVPTYEPPAVVRDLLSSKPLRVLDLGGNIGLFGAFVLDEFDVDSITTFEPDPSNVPVLHRCRATNPDRPWQVIEACAARDDGVISFVGGMYADSHVSFDNTDAVIEVPAVDVLPYMAQADLVKIDIEGSEWDILADPRLAGIGTTVVVMEWHAFRSPTADPHHAAIQMLEEAGFTVHGIDSGYPHGTIWAWNASPTSSFPA
jgi:FkbM family methyltransferase